MTWTIYLLTDHKGAPFYVGATNNLKRRLKEHKRTLGFKPTAEVLETGDGDRLAAENYWIKEYRRGGANLRNLAEPALGRQTHCQSTREKLSALGKGMPKPPGHGAKISLSTKGVPHSWTEEGLQRASATRFKNGESIWEKLPDEKKEDERRRRAQAWANITAEERSARATKRNLEAWAKRTPEEKSAIGRKIADARCMNSTPEKFIPTPETSA